MKVAVIDPSLLTWPYTPRFCDVLARNGCTVNLVACRFAFDEAADAAPASYRKWNHFYERSRRFRNAHRRGALGQVAKGAEHVIDMARLPALLERLKPDVIHYQQAPIPLVDRWFVPLLKRVAPTISTVHNTVPFHGDASWLQRAGFGGLLAAFDHLIVHTDWSRRQLVDQFRIDGRRVSTFHMPLFDEYTEGVPRVGWHRGDGARDQEQVVLSFGNISHYKGIDVLIRAFAMLPPAAQRRARLVIAGNPQIPVEPMRALAIELGIDERIEWRLGYVAANDVGGLFDRASIVAFPYRHIDGSGAFTTALNFDRPFIASRLGMFSDCLADGVHGRLVEPENPGDLAEKLAWMLDHASELPAMAAAVRRLRESWPSWDALAVGTIGVYRNVCEGRWQAA